ncbi:MAG: hypothetical protein ACJAUP_001842 [Cellvibrionaceae bacterium]|jgi:hypothetical protein
MEHRRNYRIPSNIPASIKRKQFFLGDYQTCDINAGGACIVDDKYHLNKGNFVTLEIKYNKGEHTASYFMKAVVVYRHNKKVGLMWADYDPKFSCFLQQVASLAA